MNERGGRVKARQAASKSANEWLERNGSWNVVIKLGNNRRESERILIKAHMWKLISGAQWNIFGFLEVGEIERERTKQERKFLIEGFWST